MDSTFSHNSCYFYPKASAMKDVNRGDITKVEPWLSSCGVILIFLVSCFPWVPLGTDGFRIPTQFFDFRMLCSNTYFRYRLIVSKTSN